QPVSFTRACAGGAVTLSVATASPPSSILWKKDGTPIPGAVGPTLNLTNLKTTDAGLYQAFLPSDCGAVESRPASIFVGDAPTVLQQPRSQTACPGSSVQLTVNGAFVQSLRWIKDGAVIPNVNGFTLQIAAIKPSDAGDYQVDLINECGT